MRDPAKTSAIGVDPFAAAGAVAATEGIALRRFAAGLGLADAQAEDCVQDAFVRLCTELDRGVDVRNPRAWLYRVVYRIAMDEHRRARVRRGVAVPMTEPSRPNLGLDPIDLIVTLDELDLLPSRRRQVLHLRYLAGLRFDEIALTLGITPSAARSHATQAVAMLRRRIGPRDVDEPGNRGTHRRRDEGGVMPAQPVGRLMEPVGALQPSPGGLLDSGGLDIGPDGRIWVVDAGHDAIAIFGPDGRFLERWGSPGRGPGQFSFRRALGNVGDVSFDSDGGLFVADNGNHRIQRFDAKHRFVLAWGRRGRSNGEFLDPWSVRPGGDGRIYVSDALRDDIQVFTPEGRHLLTIGRPGSGAGQLDFQGDAIVLGDELFVADHANGRIAVFGTDGHFRRAIGAGLLTGPDGLDLGPDGNLYVADSRARRHLVLTPHGRLLHSWPGPAWMIRALPDGRVLTSAGNAVRIRRAISFDALAGH